MICSNDALPGRKTVSSVYKRRVWPLDTRIRFASNVPGQGSPGIIFCSGSLRDWNINAPFLSFWSREIQWSFSYSPKLGRQIFLGTSNGVLAMHDYNSECRINCLFNCLSPDLELTCRGCSWFDNMVDFIAHGMIAILLMEDSGVQRENRPVFWYIKIHSILSMLGNSKFEINRRVIGENVIWANPHGRDCGTLPIFFSSCWFGSIRACSQTVLKPCGNVGKSPGGYLLVPCN